MSMPEYVIDTASTDLQKHTQYGEQASSGRSDQEGQSSIISPEIDPPFSEKEQSMEVNRTDEHGSGSALAKVLSRKTSCIPIDPGPPPDGGLAAWTQVIAGHLIIFNTWGYIVSFGVFQAYYVTTLGHSPSDISWVGSVQIFLLFSVGTFSGRATDYGLFRMTFLLGSILQLIGVFMTSLCTKYWQLFLAQGICTGLGNGLIFCPALALLSTYFTKKRALAIGIAASGSATGGVVFPVVVQQLLPKIGFPWTIRVVGFIMLAVQAIALTFAKTRLPPRKTGPLVEWGAFKELPYVLFAIAMFLSFWGIYFAFYYIGSYGRDVVGINQEESISNLLILNGVGLFGRVVAAQLADRYFGPLNTIIPFVFISGLLIYCWVAVTSKGGLVGFAVIYGLSTSAIQALFPATLASLTSDLKKAGVRMGMVFSFVAFACLTGPPVAGALIQKDDGSYLYAQMFAGTVMMGGCMTLIACRISKIGWMRVKV